MLVTTYQHDYLPPQTKRYDFLHGHINANLHSKDEVECQCVPDTPVDIPKAVMEQCGNVEWTGIAPMGRLVDPRIIPTKLSPEQVENMAGVNENEDCFHTQPNRFLKLLRTAYPDLYERLKQMPKDELSRRLDRQRHFTTYQIDFCNVNEYPEGVYESLKPEEGANKLKESKLLQVQSPCSEFRTNVMQELDKVRNEASHLDRDPCEKSIKPFKISFADSTRFIGSGGYSHWRANVFAKRANFSEYMDTINKNGCIIMKNNIHDHSKCRNGSHCLHKLIHVCTNK